MNLVDSLIQDIRAHPTDDAPRMALADWLQEQGDPRGEFIAVQCAIAQDEQRGIYREHLKKRQRELFADHRDAWLGTAKPFLFSTDFRRGFLDHLEMTLDGDPQVVPALAELFRREPMIRNFRIREGKSDCGRLREILRLPECPPIQMLKFDPMTLTAPILIDLVNLPQMQTIRRLFLAGNGIGSEGLLALANSPHLQMLDILDLKNTLIQNDAVIAMCRSRHFQHLFWLNLAGNPISSNGFAELGRSANLPSLTRLDLSQCTFEENALSAVLTGPGTSRIKRLSLYQCRLSAELMEGVESVPNLATTVELNMSWNEFGDRGLISLLCNPHLNSLRSLRLSGNFFTEIGVHALVTSAKLNSVEELHLLDCLTLDGFVAFVTGAGLPSLRELTIDWRGDFAEGYRTLCRSPLFTRLETLDLTSWQWRISEESRQLIIDSIPRSNLRKLTFNDRTLQEKVNIALKQRT